VNYGQQQAVMVLAGERLGFSISNTENARTLLEGKPLHPIYGFALEKEASTLLKQVRKKPEMLAQANKHCEDLIAEFRLAERKAGTPFLRSVTD